MRRSFAQVEAEARAAERLGVKRHAAEHATRVDAALSAGRIGADVATLTKQHIAAFADEITTGLHLDVADTSMTRACVRRVLNAAGLLGGRETDG